MNDAAAAIVRALHEAGDRPLSGEALSARLGVSRAQVWKHVGRLRELGYGIEGEPGGGYRLTSRPDRLLPEEIAEGLETAWLARRIDYHDQTDSTNRVALEHGRAGAPAGLTVIAEGQTAGRGRLGRSFYSPHAKNLYASILLRPDLTLAEAPTLILSTAIAVADAVAAEAGDDAVQIKWPNDILLGGLKTSGILMELSAEGTRVGHAVLGIGVNLNVDRTDFPEEFRALATSVSTHLGRPVDRVRFARHLFAGLESVVDQHVKEGFEALRPRFEARFQMRGQPVAVDDMKGERLHGLARGIAADGALEIECTEGVRRGEIVRVVAGDVTLAKPAPPSGAATSEESES